MIRRGLFLLVLPVTVALAQEPSASPVSKPPASPAPAPSPSAPLSLRGTIDTLKDEEVAKALATLKEKFLDGEKVSDSILQRATLEGMVRRLAPGASLVDTARKPAPPEEYPFLVEILDSHIGYIRLGALNAGALTLLDAALANFVAKKTDSVVLDLREVAGEGNYEVAADVARRFCPKGKLLFSVQKPSAKQERIYTSNQNPVFDGVVVVLTDSATTGAAEALAATLRENAGAMIIGSDTPGLAAEFVEAPVSGNTALRIAVAQVILPTAGPIFPGGVKPDVAIALPVDVQDQIFRESKDKGVSQFVFEAERRRLNEAALLANQNPEIDSAQAVQRDRGRTAPPRDTVLQRAVDLVIAINFYKASKS